MSKKTKKAMSMLLVVTLIAVIAVGGMLAYLTSEDSDVNVMTLGNVSIEQHEYERETNADGSYKTGTVDGKDSYLLKDFTQAKPLYPATEVDANGEPYNYGAGNWDDTMVRMAQVGSQGSMQVFENANAVDKFVTVENTGKSDAYVRTLYAFEAGSKTAAEWSTLISSSAFMNEQGVWKINNLGIVNIDGNNYVLEEFVYQGGAHLGGVHANGVLPAGETTYPGLAQVYMKAIATNEDCEALDGNNNGTYDILVLSQAVQTEGFANAQTALDTAFGKAAEKAAEWFGDEKFPIVVRTVDDMRTAMKTPGAKMVLGNDIKINDDKGTGYCLYAKYDCEIDLNGNDIIVDLPGKEFYGVVYALNGAKVDFVGDGNIEVNGGVGNFIWCTGEAGVNIYGGNWTQSSNDFSEAGDNYCEGMYANNKGNINIYGGMFDWGAFSKYTLNERNAGAINVYGGTFINFDPRVSHDSDGSYVAEGYKVVSETQANGDIWYTVVPE